MANKVYIVLEDQKYVGKHRTYSAGMEVPEIELFGDEKNLEVALNGQKEMKSKDGLIQKRAKKAKLKLKSGSKKKAE